MSRLYQQVRNVHRRYVPACSRRRCRSHREQRVLTCARPTLKRSWVGQCEKYFHRTFRCGSGLQYFRGRTAKVNKQRGFHHQYNFICSCVTPCNQRVPADESRNPVSTQCCVVDNLHVCLTAEQCNSIGSVEFTGVLFLMPKPIFRFTLRRVFMRLMRFCTWNLYISTIPPRTAPPSLSLGPLSSTAGTSSASSVAVGGASSSVMGFSLDPNSAFVSALLATLADVIEPVRAYATHCRRSMCMHDDHHR